MDSRSSFRWTVSNFSKQTANRLYSDVFIASGCTWRVLIFPKGNKTNHLSLYLEVPVSTILPRGWTRNTLFALTLVSAVNPSCSLKKITLHLFTESASDFGFTSFIPLTKLHDRTKGYLVNDTLRINIEVCVARVSPAVNTCLAGPSLDELIEEAENNGVQVGSSLDSQDVAVYNNFEAHFASLDELIEEAETNGVQVGSSLQSQDVSVTSETPSLEEVVEAKQSLKECLSDLFKLNMKERLSTALSTLSSARDGLSTEQRKAIQKFLANFDEFTSDFLSFEQDNAEFELHKIKMDKMFLAMKKGREIHTLYKHLMEDITKGEREMKRKMEQMQCRKDKLLSDWEILLVESAEAKSGYNEEKKKVAEAEEKKRMAEERMSRSTTAWSDLKAFFC